MSSISDKRQNETFGVIKQDYKSSKAIINTSHQQNIKHIDSNSALTLQKNALDNIKVIYNAANKEIGDLYKSEGKYNSKVAKKVEEIHSKTQKALGEVIANYNIGVITEFVEKNNNFSNEQKETVRQYIQVFAAGQSIPGEAKDIFMSLIKLKGIPASVRNSIKNTLKRAAITTALKIFTSSIGLRIIPEKSALQQKIDLAIKVNAAFLDGKQNFLINIKENYNEQFKKTYPDHEFKELPLIHQEEHEKIQNDFQTTLARQANVAGAAGIYIVGQEFHPKKTKKQIQSFIAQQRNLEERPVIEKPIELEVIGLKGESRKTNLRTVHTPFNKHFDEKIGNSNFEKIAGTGGLGSLKRGEHIVNGFVCELYEEGKDTPENVILRHGILAYRFEPKQEVRKEIANQMAKEILTAAIKTNMLNSGNTLDEISQKQPWQQTIVSISLVTPDMLRSAIEQLENLFHGTDFKACEEALWRAQKEALDSFQGQTIEIEIDNKKIKVELDIISLNTGVNIGAVLGMGSLEQWESVATAVHRLGKICERFPDDPEIQSLLKDAKRLCRTPISYLTTGNQHELAAKVQLLTNELSKKLKETGNSGIISLINCMSGKDRTGICIATIFTFMEMKKILGHIPTTEEMAKPENQDLFVRIYKQMLAKYGGLEITKLNTGAYGYKVGKEAMLYPNSKEWLKGVEEIDDAYVQIALESGTTSG